VSVECRFVSRVAHNGTEKLNVMKQWTKNFLPGLRNLGMSATAQNAKLEYRKLRDVTI
jgi:hypothetical protein